MSETTASSNAPTDPERDGDEPIPGTGDPVATGTKGGGEWPDPATPPSDAAPGSDPERQRALEAERRRSGPGASAEDHLHPPAVLERSTDDPQINAVGSIGSEGVRAERQPEAGEIPEAGEAS